MSYTQLAEEQRYQIYALMKAGHRQTNISAVVGVHKSTISREVRRHRGWRGYPPSQAHQLAVHRRQTKAQCRLTPEPDRASAAGGLESRANQSLVGCSTGHPHQSRMDLSVCASR